MWCIDFVFVRNQRVPKSARSQPSDMTSRDGRTVGERNKGKEIEVSNHFIKVTRLISPETRLDTTFWAKMVCSSAIHGCTPVLLCSNGADAPLSQVISIIDAMLAQSTGHRRPDTALDHPAWLGLQHIMPKTAPRRSIKSNLTPESQWALTKFRPAWGSVCFLGSQTPLTVRFRVVWIWNAY